MELRLFPLRTVLFPGMELPLQVFEERYKQLVAECLREHAPFGVALLRDGPEVGGEGFPYSRGTTARIASVEPTVAGQLLLRAVGEQRFHILSLHHNRPYLWADVEYPVDEVGAVPEALLERARAQYATLARLRLTARGEYARRIPTPDAAGALADAIGGALTAPLRQLQGLLETIDVRQRLERAVELLEESIRLAHGEVAAAVARRYGEISSLN